MADALSGVVVGKLVNQAFETFKNIQEFVPTLERSIEISNALGPVVEQIKSFNDVLDRPREETERLEKHTDNKELIRKSKKLSLNLWKFLLFPGQRAKLQKQDEAFQRYLSLVQLENKRDLMEVLTHLKYNHVNQIRGLNGAPQEPEFIGMVKQFNELKAELMKDGASVLVLTGLGGSGKTTLAKKLCWDPQVKGKFRGNIFFVTFSETPNLKNIVNTLFEQCGRPVPDFTNEEDAINRLEALLIKVDRDPILLVLDDVWPKSEDLVEKFKFQMPNYKILVTSRVGFRRFGTPCQLNPLDEDPAVSLFHHYAQLNHISSYMPEKDLVNEIVKACKGSPLVLKVIAGSLRNQPFETWQNMTERLKSQSILESNSTDFLCYLQPSLDILEDINKKCFMDMEIFSEDQRIPVTVLIDMWTELYNLDEDGIKAMVIVHDLITRNLINVIATRQVATETDMYYNNHYVMQHDLLRDLAILQSKGESSEQSKRLIINLNGDNRPDWWIGPNQQGIISFMCSFITGMLVKQRQLKVSALLVLKVIAGSLRNQPFEKWLDMKERLNSQSIFESNSTDLLCRLQQSLDMLEDIKEKKCFLDMGLFPEDQRIPVTVLIDMWAELYNLDEDGIKAMTIIHDLISRNFINVIATRQVATKTDRYYNNHYVMLHDLLRELAIHQSKEESFEQRKRLIIDLNGNNWPDWWVGPNQQGIISRRYSFITGMLVKQKQLKVAARILCISTDENFSSDWCDMQPDKAEVLVLNLRSDQYSLPDFTKKMSKLKVLIVTNYGFHRSELTKFELLGSLSNLKRIRLEKVSVPCLCILKNLRKLSLHMCNTRDAFESCSIQISDAMPNLVELSIDYCNDLIKLPDGFCKITTLKKLSITNCHKFSAMPQDIGKLVNLEVLRLCSCSDLKEMPESVADLNKLRCLDMSDCVTLHKLPNNIGDLLKLEKLYMKGCSNLSELPASVINFGNLKHEMQVICDEEGSAIWEHFSNIPKLKIYVPKVEHNLIWLNGTRS